MAKDMTDDIYDPRNIRQLLKINELNLEEELSTVASFYFSFSDLANDAEAYYKKSILELESLEVDLSRKIKEELLAEGVKQDKITETEIKRRFRKDQIWMTLKTKELDAYTAYRKLEKAAKAFEMKSQNCMSINKRQLYKAGRGMEDL